MDEGEKLSHGMLPSFPHCMFTGSQLGLRGGQGNPILPLRALPGTLLDPKLSVPSNLSGKLNVPGIQSPWGPRDPEKVNDVAGDDGQWCHQSQKDPGGFLVYSAIAATLGVGCGFVARAKKSQDQTEPRMSHSSLTS